MASWAEQKAFFQRLSNAKVAGPKRWLSSNLRSFLRSGPTRPPPPAKRVRYRIGFRPRRFQLLKFFDLVESTFLPTFFVFSLFSSTPIGIALSSVDRTCNSSRSFCVCRGARIRPIGLRLEAEKGPSPLEPRKGCETDLAIPLPASAIELLTQRRREKMG